MSRTRKDRPVFVRESEKIKRGEIDHHHAPGGYHESWFKDNRLSIEIPKGDLDAVKAHEEKLRSMGARWTVTEVKPQPRFNIDEGTVSYTPKKLSYKVERFWSREAHDGECKISGGTRTRDRSGHCYPSWAPDDWPSEKIRTRVSRSKAKGALKKAQALANGGSLDEDYSDFNYEDENGPKVWIY